jgi:tRNA pseudouridine13 synthase
MFVHAYQAYLWNEVAKISQEDTIPLIGFATDLSKYKAAPDMEKILGKEEVSAADFMIKAMPELSGEGSERERITKAKGLKWSFADDELNQGKIKCIIGFEIPKGSYATSLIKQILC